MERPTIDADLINEELVLNYIKFFYEPENLLEIKDLIKHWSEFHSMDFLTLNNEKRKLFSRKFNNEQLGNLVKDLKKKDASFFELVCLAVVLKVQGYSSLFGVQPPHRKRVVRTKSLSDRIKLLYPEIQILKYQQHLSWTDVARELKKNHRYQFEHYKLDASYLRQVILDLERKAK